MRRFWAIRSADNDTYLATFAPGLKRWVDDEREALSFGNEKSALLVIETLLNGRGIAVECTVPA